MLRARLPEAESLGREALAMGKRFPSPYSGDGAAWLGNLATILKHQGKFAEAESMYREALDLSRKLLGNEHREVAAISGLKWLLLFLNVSDPFSPAFGTLVIEATINMRTR